MRYTPEHKERRRDRLVSAASRLFRRRGFEGASVADVMAAASLTHGGFYGYFEDKAALCVEALRAAFVEGRRNLFSGSSEEIRGRAWLEATAARYLTMAHRDAPDRGCAIPALGAEIARGPEAVRGAFTEEIAILIEQMSERVGGPNAREVAIANLAQWVGALVLARAVDDADFAEAILDATRANPRPEG